MSLKDILLKPMGKTGFSISVFVLVLWALFLYAAALVAPYVLDPEERIRAN